LAAYFTWAVLIAFFMDSAYGFCYDGFAMRPLYERAAAGVLVLIFAALCVSSAMRKSATVVESAYVPAGLYTWKTHDFGLYDEAPAAGRMFTTAAALLLDPQVDTIISRFPDDGWRPWSYASEFLRMNFAGYGRILLAARLSVVVMGVLLCLVVWRSAREGYGEWGGLLSLSACALSPTLIAHSRLATADVMAALFSLVFFMSLMEYFNRPRVTAALGLAVALGFSMLARYTCLLWAVFALFAPFLAKVTDFTESLDKPGKVRMVFHTLVVIVVAWLVVVAGYQGKNVGRHPDMEFSSRALKLLSPAARYAPLPRDFLSGLDHRLLDARAEEWGRGHYLFGERYQGGKWYYYLAALAVKEPIAHLVLFLGAVFLIVIRRPRDRDELILLSSIVALLVAGSLFGALQDGIRFMLPAYPAAFVLMGKLGSEAFEKAPEWPAGFEGKFAPTKSWKKGFRIAERIGLGLLVAAMLGQHALIWPDYIPYFNLAARHFLKNQPALLNSDLDWGQDLPGLARWMKKNDLNAVDLAYCGHDDPARFKISYTLPARHSDNKFIAVSADFLAGEKYPMTFLAMPVRPDDPLWDEVATYRDAQPVAVIGGSIFIFKK